MGLFISNKNLDNFPLRHSESGQATTEYILLLFLIVAIFTIASAKLFTPVKKWADFYLGQYTYCLIDTGSLPKEAGGNPTECEQLAAQNGYGAAAADAAKKNSEKLQEEAAARAKEKALADAQRAHNARKTRGSRGGGRSSASSDGASFDRPKGADRSSEDDSSAKIKQVASFEKNSKLASIVSAEGGRGPQRSMMVPFSGTFAEEQEKIMRREAAIMQVSSASEIERTMKPRKLKFDPPKRKEAAISSEEGVGFSFGGMIRMVIIGGILTVIIYLVGSQVDAVMKGSD